MIPLQIVRQREAVEPGWLEVPIRLPYLLRLVTKLYVVVHWNQTCYCCFVCFTDCTVYIDNSIVQCTLHLSFSAVPAHPEPEFSDPAPTAAEHAPPALIPANLLLPASQPRHSHGQSLQARTHHQPQQDQGRSHQDVVAVPPAGPAVPRPGQPPRHA